MVAFPSPPAAESRSETLLYDGTDRVPLLPLARLITLAPSAAQDDPVHVGITWEPGHTEFPVPGSSLWRAALTRWLASTDSSTVDKRILRVQVTRSLQRFPSLESWWQWVRSGWSAPLPPILDRGNAARTHGWAIWRRR